MNGSRGKSTVTRLLTGALAAAGHRPLGKTTGTAPRLLRGWDLGEEPVHRRPEGPNIGEQRIVVRRAAALGADSLVFECMAVSPDYQATFHRELLRPDVLVVTNALDDHLAEMGPTAGDVAEVFAATIPDGGVVAVVPGPHLGHFATVARDRGATLLVAEPHRVEDAVLRRFDHLVLAEHVALVLAVTRHLGIRDALALSGMVAAPADPYATRLLPVGDPADPALFVNAFPANDPVSTLGVWEQVRGRRHPAGGLVVVMNCRDDRVERTRQFASSVLPQLPIDVLVVTGASTRPVLRAAAGGTIDARRVIDLTGATTDAVVEALEALLRGRVVMGVGNLHGGGLELVERLQDDALVTVDQRGVA